MSGSAAYSHHSLGVGAVVPLVLAASRRTELAGLGMVDGQMQGDGAVAALRCLEVLYIVTARGVCAVVPLVLAASRRTELAGLGIVDGQMQGDGAVATLRCLGSAAYSHRSWCTCCRSIGTGCKPWH